MSKAGWVKLDKAIYKHEFWQEETPQYSRLKALMDLKINAVSRTTTKETKGREIILHPGESCRSFRYLMKRWNWSNTKIDRFFNVCIRDGFITKRIEKNITILKVCDFERATIGKTKKTRKSKKFIPPTFAMVTDYFLKQISNVGLAKSEAKKFFFYYKSVDWKKGKSPMVCWKSAVMSWLEKLPQMNYVARSKKVKKPASQVLRKLHTNNTS